MSWYLSTIFQIDPESRTSAVLGLSNNAVSELLLPMLMVEEFSVLSYANDSLDKFSNKVKRIFHSDHAHFTQIFS